MENFTKGYTEKASVIIRATNLANLERKINDFLANYPRLEKISLCKKTFPALNEKEYIVATLSYTLSFDDIN